ncbi:MAG: TIR domain-containing protein [Pirellulaceae bacterium]|nr:TIR domain-containing protein [Pirellulaceae bacterium]
MPAVFISYRRSDSSDITGRIFDRLVGHFGSKPVKVVRDVDSIPIGEDFRDILRERIQECDVVLVVIGPNWTSLKDSKGVRRLDDAADTVRIEIEQALELKKKVIPVCVTHATMPAEDDLPVAIKKLAFRNGVQVRPDPDFNNDIKRLTEALDKIFKDKQIADAKPPTLPPPQRHLHAPEPQPPFMDPRRSTGSQDSHSGNLQGPPVSAQVVAPVPVTTRPSGDSTPGNWPRPGNTGPSLQQPPTFNQSGVRPLQTNKPRLSSSVFTSATGIALLLTGLVSLCMCGGMFASFIVSEIDPDAGKEHNTSPVEVTPSSSIQSDLDIIDHPPPSPSKFPGSDFDSTSP